MPVESVAAEAERDLADFLAAAVLAPPHREQPEHETLIRDAVDVVQLRGDALAGDGEIPRVRFHPGDGRHTIPTFVNGKSWRLPIAAVTTVGVRSRRDVAQAETPNVAEWVVKERRPIVNEGGLAGAAPMNAVGRDGHLERIVVKRRHLVATPRILLEQIEPHRAGVAEGGIDDIGAGHDVKPGAHPVHTVSRGGEARLR